MTSLPTSALVPIGGLGLPLPELLLVLPLLTAALCRFVPGRATARRISVAGAGATLVAALALAGAVARPGADAVRGATGWFYVDALGAYMVAVVGLVAALAAWYAAGYLPVEAAHGAILPGDERRYHGWFHLFVATMAATCLLDNLGLVWAAIEATTLASALLVGFYRHEAALEAAWKYLVLCSAGITLALAGVILVYYAGIRALGPGAGTLDWSALAPVAERLDPRLMGLAFVFILVGYGTKAGLAPMHTWLPDAHSQAPTPVSAVLSGVLLNCALYGILRVHALAATAASAAGGATRSFDLLLALGLVSVAVAVPFVLVQHDLKRLLAYSSVEHTGLVALAVGIGTPLALYGALLHVLTHAVTKTLLFGSAGVLIQRYGTRRIARLRGAAQAAPLAGTVFLLGALAIGGSPPFAPFTSEFAILAGAFAGRSPLVAIGLLAALAAIFAGLLQHGMRVTLGRAPKRLHDPAESDVAWQGEVEFHPHGTPRPALAAPSGAAGTPAAHAPAGILAPAPGPRGPGAGRAPASRWAAGPLLAAGALMVLLGIWVPPVVRDAAAAAAAVLPLRTGAAAAAAAQATSTAGAAGSGQSPGGRR